MGYPVVEVEDLEMKIQFKMMKILAFTIMFFCKR